jgi:hypothetical protein
MISGGKDGHQGRKGRFSIVVQYGFGGTTALQKKTHDNLDVFCWGAKIFLRNHHQWQCVRTKVRLFDIL